MLLIETDYGNMNIDINTKIGKYETVEKMHLDPVIRPAI